MVHVPRYMLDSFRVSPSNILAKTELLFFFFIVLHAKDVAPGIDHVTMSSEHVVVLLSLSFENATPEGPSSYLPVGLPPWPFTPLYADADLSPENNGP